MAVLTRRELLARGLAMAAVAGGPWALRDQGVPGHRAVLVILGGGVRPQDTIDHPDNTPALRRLAADGVLFTNARASAPAGPQGVRAILTGVPEEEARPADEPPAQPTLPELVRKDGPAAPEECWMVLSGDDWSRGRLVSGHTDYGAAFAPSILVPDRLLASDAGAALRAMDAQGAGRPVESPGLRELLGTLDAARSASGKDALPVAAGTELKLALHAFLVEECRLEATERGPGIADRRALRAAIRLLCAVRPRLLVVVLGDAAIAEKSARDQAAVLKGNDALLGTLWDAVNADAAMRTSTAVFVVPDVGRNRKVSDDGALRRDEGGLEPSKVFIAAAGAGLKRNQVVKSAVSSSDVAPTIGQLLGVKSPHSRGRVLRAALA